MNPASEPVAFMLSQEELVFLLRLINTHTLPGLGTEPLGALPPETEKLLLDAAARALLARQLAQVDAEHQLQADPAVLSALTVCAQPNQNLNLVLQNGHGAEQRFFYRVPELAVSHAILGYGLHQFTLATNSDFGRERVNELLSTLPPSGPDGPYTLPQPVLAQAQSAAAQGPAAAEAALASANLPPAAAQSFAQALAQPIARLALQFVYQTNPPNQQVLTLLASAQDNWLLTAADFGQPTLTLERLSSTQVSERVDKAYAGYA